MMVDLLAFVALVKDTSCGKRFFVESMGCRLPISVAYLP